MIDDSIGYPTDSLSTNDITEFAINMNFCIGLQELVGVKSESTVKKSTTLTITEVTSNE